MRVAKAITPIVLAVAALSAGLVMMRPHQVADAYTSSSQLNDQSARLRIILRQGSLGKIKENIGASDEALGYRDLLVRHAQNMLTESPVQPVTGKQLEVSRTALKRIQTMGLLWHLTKDSRWQERGKTELLALCSFPSWNPEHFLDTAEAMTAAGIGYDWFYSTLSEAERTRIREAIVRNGLLPAQAAYNSGAFWTTDNTTNWNIVCNSGTLIACLAIDGDMKERNGLVEQLELTAFAHLKAGMQYYNPDGASSEGPMYWRYATKYATMAAAALESFVQVQPARAAKLNANEITHAPGFSNTGDYYVDVSSPIKKTFNYADSEDPVAPAPWLFYLSGRFSHPAWAYFERHLLSSDASEASALDLIWFDKSGTAEDLQGLPRSMMYGGDSQVVTMRQKWNDALTSYGAFKGGSNGAHHADLDLGTFVFDSLGNRWAADLGGDNYDLPGYFINTHDQNSQRWNYYRTSTRGQNTVVINDRNQDCNAKAEIVSSRLLDDQDVTYAIADLQQAYASQKVQAQKRGIALSKKTGEFMIEDEIQSESPFSPVWQMHTAAEIKCFEASESSNSIAGAISSRDVTSGANSSGAPYAILNFVRKKMYVRVLEPQNARLSVQEVNLQKPELPSSGIKKLVVKTDAPTSNVRFRVVITPLRPGEHTAFDQSIPLSEWSKFDIP